MGTIPRAIRLMILEQIPHKLENIPQGVAGIKATLKRMRELVIAGKRNPAIRRIALRITSHLKQKDWAGEVRALNAWVRDNVRYVKDINGIETLHTPEKILEMMAGDCDDKSILLATFLESIGHPARFVAVGPEKNRYLHVYVQTLIGKKWVSLEPTEPWPSGKEVPWKHKMIIHI